MGRWVAIWGLGGCNVAFNAVLPSSDDEPLTDTGSTTDTPANADDVLISEVTDGAGDVKFVELFNPTERDIDLTGYELWRYTNGSSTVTPPPLPLDDAVVRPGETFVISGDPDAFDLEYPTVVPNLVGENTVLGNGDDVYELVYASGGAVEVVDVYGEIGAEGIGSAWDYEDKSAKRAPEVVSGRTTWKENEWVITRWGTANPGVR